VGLDPSDSAIDPQGQESLAASAALRFGPRMQVSQTTGASHLFVFNGDADGLCGASPRPASAGLPRSHGRGADGSAPSRCARSPSTQWRGTRALPTGWGGFGRGRPRPAPLPREKGVVSRIPSRNTMTATSHIDVFNGDADGLCALQQLRLAEPGSAPSRCARSPSTQWRGTRALPTGWGGLGGDAQGRCRASPVGEACPERSRRRGRGNEVSTPPLLACVLI
jgi:hypothetical protein